MRAWVRRLHVLSTAIVGAQLLVWTGTGLAFTLFDFAEVRGTNDRAPPRPVELASVRIGADEAARVAAASHGAPVEGVLLASLADRPTYRVSFTGGADPVLVDGRNGAIVPVDADAATRIASFAHRSGVRARSVERHKEDDREVFAVALDDPMDTVVTVDARTGEIAAWKNRAYRRFDALWSLHVLGYLDRKSPANWPLRVVALLAMLVTASGAGLLLGGLVRRLRERNHEWPVTKSPPCVSGS